MWILAVLECRAHASVVTGDEVGEEVADFGSLRMVFEIGVVDGLRAAHRVDSDDDWCEVREHVLAAHVQNDEPDYHD